MPGNMKTNIEAVMLDLNGELFVLIF